MQQPTAAKSEEAAVDGCGCTKALHGVGSSAAGEGPNGIATVETTKVPRLSRPSQNLYTFGSVTCVYLLPPSIFLCA